MTPVDLIIILLGLVLPTLFFFRNSLPFIGGRAPSGGAGSVPGQKIDLGGIDDGDDPRDFVDKMERGVSTKTSSSKHQPVTRFEQETDPHP